jgi:hypothetical protein
MKSTQQAWGWLAAGVLAAGLNAAYHDGDLAWAHRIADRAQHVSNAVVALASGHADQFLAEARMLSVQNDDQATEFTDSVVATADQETARTEAAYARAEARQQAHCARIEAIRARIESRVAAHRAFVRIPDVRVETSYRTLEVPGVGTISLPRIELSQTKIARCSHIRMSLPAMPNMGVPATPEINVSLSNDSDE